MIDVFTTTRTQGEMRPRCVTLANLLVMCTGAGGTAHRFTVSRVTKTRAYVEYSNPDEYGTESPMTAAFPLLANDFEPSNPWVVLGHMVGLTNDTWHGEGWQAFSPIVDGPELFRASTDPITWRTREEIEAARAGAAE